MEACSAREDTPMIRSRTVQVATALAAAVVLVVFVAGRAAAPPNPKPTAKPKAQSDQKYTVRKIEGFSIHVNDELLTTHKDLGDKALKLMAVKLYDVTRVVPPKALAELRKVHIWLERDNPKGRCACYHPSRRWLTSHGHNPEKAKCVEIANATRFLAWSHAQPSMVLHELAHAYHHQVITHGDKDVQAAYKQAVASKRYEKVLYVNGREKRAYALNNQMEYFAELTEAFFGVNDFYPFVRAEITKHDPQGYKAVKKAWGG